jgi:hypothetical protein
VVLLTIMGGVAMASASLHTDFLGGTRVPDHCAIYCTGHGGYAPGNVLAFIAALSANIVGTVVLVAGAGYSALRTYRAGLARNLTIGNCLILVGALVVAGAASLTRFGVYELFYAGQAAGIAIIFGGFALIGSVAHARPQLA